LAKNRARGLQWPVGKTDTPILHLEDFRTKDGLGRFKYHQYTLREQVQKVLHDEQRETFYLTTGRTIVHYNNGAQTGQSEKLLERHSEDVIQVSFEDQDKFTSEKVILKNKYGQTKPLAIKFVKTLKIGTMFCTFHHAKSHINYIFGDEADDIIKTARFKSVEVEVVPAI
jgi:formate dehydrogenase major subunit